MPLTPPNTTVTTTRLPKTESATTYGFREGFALFLISFLILFLELAAIRWFPAHVLYLTFFTNVVLLASFLGMSVGCMAASHRRNYLGWTPLLLVVALASRAVCKAGGPCATMRP